MTETKEERTGSTLLQSAISALTSVLLLVLLTFSGPRHAARILNAQNQVLITEFQNTTGLPNLGGRLDQILLDSMTRSDRYRIKSDLNAKRIFQHVMRNPRDQIFRDIARRFCLRRGIGFVLLPRVRDWNGSFLISVQMVDIANNSERVVDMIRADRENELAASVRQVSAKARDILDENAGEIWPLIKSR
jgi:hypothetical protein